MYLILQFSSQFSNVLPIKTSVHGGHHVPFTRPNYAQPTTTSTRHDVVAFKIAKNQAIGATWTSSKVVNPKQDQEGNI